MKTRIHAAAGVAGFILIGLFWTSTVVSELFGSHQAISAVKSFIVWGMAVLIPCLMVAGVSGMAMGSRRQDPPALRKKRRMPFIALNGLLVLIPAALFLAARAQAGVFDGWFYTVQIIELTAGAINLVLLGLNIQSFQAVAEQDGCFPGEAPGQARCLAGVVPAAQEAHSFG